MSKIKYTVCYIFTFIILITITASPVLAGTFSDDFNDNVSDGWLSVPQGTFYPLGNWRIENGILIEDQGNDHKKFLVENLSLTDQFVESNALFHNSGYGGITIWHYDVNNWVDILVYPAGGMLRIIESIDGVLERYDTPLTTSQLQWHRLKVGADSTTGTLSVNLDDDLIGTHTVTTIHRSGLSGLNSGNAGGSFDDFMISTNSIVNTPQSKSACLKGGWKTFTSPVFKNQGSCISYVSRVQ